MPNEFVRTTATCARCGAAVYRAETLLPLGAFGEFVDLDVRDILPIDFATWSPSRGVAGLYLFVEDDLVAAATAADEYGPFYRPHVCEPVRESA